MTMTLEGPYIGTTSITLLPNPIFNDAEALDVELDYTESMNGTPYSYVKNPGTTKITLTFENIGRGKLLEIQEFLIAFIGKEVRLRNFRDEVWKVAITSDPHDFINKGRSGNSGGPRFEQGNFTIVFIGVKVSG